MKAAKFCPVCEAVWDLSHDYCPEHDGVLLLRVWNYSEAGFVIFKLP